MILYPSTIYPFIQFLFFRNDKKVPPKRKITVAKICLDRAFRTIGFTLAVIVLHYNGRTDGSRMKDDDNAEEKKKKLVTNPQSK